MWQMQEELEWLVTGRHSSLLECGYYCNQTAQEKGPVYMLSEWQFATILHLGFWWITRTLVEPKACKQLSCSAVSPVQQRMLNIGIKLLLHNDYVVPGPPRVPGFYRIAQLSLLW